MTPEIWWPWMGKRCEVLKNKEPQGPTCYGAGAPVGVTLARRAVDDKTMRAQPSRPILEQLSERRSYFAMEALLTQRHIAQTIVEQRGYYVMIVKEMQPRLRPYIELVVTLPPSGPARATARTVDLGHGRIEQRNITTSAALVGCSDWPGLAQCLRWDSTCSSKKRSGTDRSGLSVTSLRRRGEPPSACSPW